MRKPMLLASMLLLAVPTVHAQVCNNEPPKQCDMAPPPGEDGCPKFYAQSQPGGPVSQYSLNAPIPAMAECYPAPGGMVCEGWAQDVGYQKDILTYTWTVKVGNVTTTTCPSTGPYLSVPCSPNQSVRVTLTLENGTYMGTATQDYSCGAEIQ